MFHVVSTEDLLTWPLLILIWKAFIARAFVSLCPWPLLAPHLFLFPCISSISVSVSVRTLVAHSLQPQPRDRWATGPLTVITDPFPSHHLAPDLLFLSSEHRASFLQSQVQEVVMISVHSGYSPWATSNSKSPDTFLSHYHLLFSDVSLLCYCWPVWAAESGWHIA